MSATHDFLEGLLLAASRLSIWGALMSASADMPTWQLFKIAIAR